MTVRNRKLIWTVGGMIAAAAVVAFNLLDTRPPQSVETATTEKHSVAPSILASGTLAYESEVHLVPEVIGRVREVLVSEGDEVTAGQLLLRLDPATYLAEIAQLEAARRQAELEVRRARVNLEREAARFKRFQALRGQGIVDANSYEEIAAQRDITEVELSSVLERQRQTEAQLTLARERLAKTEFRAPMAGTVTALFIKVGETAVPSAMSIAGSDTIVVANTRSLHAEINVDETDVARVSVDQDARIVPAAFPDKAWIGTVDNVAISPRPAQSQGRNYLVKVRLAHRDDIQFRPGMSCRTEILTRAADVQPALAIPIEAVRYDERAEEDADEHTGSKASVFVAAAGTARRREVTTGVADDTLIEILSGLEAGDLVIRGPAKILRTLRDGDRIEEKATDTP